MTTKRGEGAAKRRELSQRLRRIATGLRIEGAINMAGTFVQAAEVIEASAPSALIAAVEAIQNELAADYNGKAPILQRPRREILSQTIEELNGVLNLLRSPPTEEVA